MGRRKHKRPPPRVVWSLLSYDPATGEMRWRVAPTTSIPAGAIAGSINHVGYRKIGIRGACVWAHHVAFVLMEGRWPKYGVDHINGDPSDNRWANLREATKAQNGANRGVQRNSKSGLKGVVRYRGRYRAHINKYLGTFRTAREAADAYARANAILNGPFARTTFGDRNAAR